MIFFLYSSTLQFPKFLPCQAGMGDEPHTNSAGGKAFGQWLYNRRKGVEAWIKELEDF